MRLKDSKPKSTRCPKQSQSFVLDSKPGIDVAPSGPSTLSRRNLVSKSPPSSSSSSGAQPRIGHRESRPSPVYQKRWWFVVTSVSFMALSFFGIVLVVLLGHGSDHGSSSSVHAAKSEEVHITYGTVLKLMHERSKFRLHSHDVPYGSGSGQQSVTSFPNVDDSNSYWIVRPQLGTSAKQGDAIQSGTIIRLQHMRTRKWLHSHLHASPISGNLEVSCFGSESESDTGDYWRLLIEGSGKTWKQEQRVRLQHVDTSAYLHSHDKKYTRIAGGQQEVCGVREKRADNIWLAAEGAYLPVTGSK